MKRGWWKSAATRAALVLMMVEATQTIGCGCGSPQERRGDPTFLSTPPSANSHSAAVSASTPPSPQEVQDPWDMVLVLSDPRLAAAQRAWNASNYASASQALRKALAEHNPSGQTRARWLYLLGDALVQSADPEGAATSFDKAAKESWILRDYALLRAAQAFAESNQHEKAAHRSASVNPNLPISTSAKLVHADALDAMGSRKEAVEVWQSHLSAHPRGRRWVDGSVRVARALLDSAPGIDKSIDKYVEALNLARRVLSEAPTSKRASEALEMEREALSMMTDAQRRKFEPWPVEALLKRAEALADRGRRKKAMDTLDELLNGRSFVQLTDGVGCSATRLKAKLLGLNRKKRAASADMYAAAVRRCEKHKSDLVKALYTGAKMHARVGRLKQALSMFARVEREFSSHRLADDARLRGARVALLMRKEPKFEAMLSTMAGDYPEGDMVEDGLFELALHHINRGQWGKAIAPLKESVQVRPREKNDWTGGRARYFLARAYESMGKIELARQTYERVVAEHPLSYYMILAYGRLRAKLPLSAAESLKRAESAVVPLESKRPVPAKLSGVGFKRAVELLALQQVQDGRSEIKKLGLRSSDGDALLLVARMYARAGDARLAHQVARMQSDTWTRAYPQGKWRESWELAYPQVYFNLVRQETNASGIPIPLAYAIMREESAFDADVVSWADAYGLMQLIMPTARGVARSLKMQVDESSLVKPEVNIKLGCRLLSSLRSMFPSAKVLAIPSYNAGAGATKRWLRERSSDEFDLWVENITYDETRSYTKRVLSTIAVYSYLYYPNELAVNLQLPEQLN